MHGMNIYPQKRTVVLPITTRGAGFIIRTLVCRLNSLAFRELNCRQLAGALYRTTLLAIEVKLGLAREHVSFLSTYEGFREFDIGIDFVRRISTLNENFSPITEYIKALGRFTARSIQYLPKLPDDSIVDQTNVYDPCYITFSNLRQYVVAMSTSETPLDHRTYFYDHSPIPNASWTVTMEGEGTEGGQIRNPTLCNPDEVMPDEYGYADLLSDMKIVRNAVMIVERKYPKLVSYEKIDYTAKGHPCQLTSCTASDIRCNDLGIDSAMNSSIMGTCELENFWSLGNLTSSVLFPGVKYLFGEVPRHSKHGTFATRQYQAAAVTFNSDIVACMSHMEPLYDRI